MAAEIGQARPDFVPWASADSWSSSGVNLEGSSGNPSNHLQRASTHRLSCHNLQLTQPAVMPMLNFLRRFTMVEEGEMGVIAWIVVGLVAGWLAGQVMKGGGYGVVVDIILGILGGIVGGWVFGLLGFSSGGGMIGSIIVAFIGAVILIGITRLLKRA